MIFFIRAQYLNGPWHIVWAVGVDERRSAVSHADRRAGWLTSSREEGGEHQA